MGHVEAAQFLIRSSRQASAISIPPVFGNANSGSPNNSLPAQGLTELHELALCSDEQLPSQFTVSLSAPIILYCIIPLHICLPSNKIKRRMFSSPYFVEALTLRIMTKLQPFENVNSLALTTIC